MEIPTLLAIIATSSVLTAMVSAWLNRRKTSAETNDTVAKTAIEVVKNTVAPLNKRIDQLEERNERLETAIENVNAEVLKIQLAFVINEAQIEALGHKPMVSLDDLSCISVDELREIAREIKEKK